jgi:hypothetical protein
VRKPRNNEVGEWWRPGQIAIIMQQRLHMHFDANKVGVILTSMGFKSTYHRGKKGYQVVLLDYDESKRIAKERSVQSVSLEADSLEPEEPQPMDISQAPLSIQEGYSRLLGEKDEDN